MVTSLVRVSAVMACVVLLFDSPAASAQTAEPLPAALSGRWTFIPPGGRTIIDYWSIQFEGDRAPGTVKGRLNFRGRGCGAKDEPVVATWDGQELKLVFIGRPDVNVQVSGATYCGDGRTELSMRRKPGSRDFEGEVVTNTGARVAITAAP